MSTPNVLTEHENAGQEVTRQVSSGSVLAESVFHRHQRRTKRPYWSTHGIPDTRNSAGRPVWEPPILDCSEWIGEVYEKKREAMLKFLKGDKARTTELMDIDMENGLLEDYQEWARVECEDARSSSEAFFQALHDEVEADFFEVSQQWSDHGAYAFQEKDDGTYDVVSYDGDGPVAYWVCNTIDEPPRPMTLAGIPITTEQNPPEYKFFRISSSNDEAKEPAWLDSLDASVPPPISSQAPSQHNQTPLALRLLSLRSAANQDTGKTEEKHLAYEGEDDLD